MQGHMWVKQKSHFFQFDTVVGLTNYNSATPEFDLLAYITKIMEIQKNVKPQRAMSISQSNYSKPDFIPLEFGV